MRSLEARNEVGGTNGIGHIGNVDASDLNSTVTLPLQHHFGPTAIKNKN
jgi:hypothetical protein